jgi:FG-GAP repeat
VTLLAGASSTSGSAEVGALPTSSAALQQQAGTADFNGDGRVDLAVGAPRENVGATFDAGAVSIFYGVPGGLPNTAGQTLVQGNAEAGDQFGAALSVGNFNGDSFTDLAVGAPGEDVGTTSDAGAVNVFYGAAAGLPATSQVLLQNNPEAGDQFGAALAQGLFSNAPGTTNTDGFSDLMVGAPGENVGGTADAGAVNAFNNTTGALSGTSGPARLQDNPEPGDLFGSALTAGPFAGDMFYDLAVGAPGENVGGTVDAGAINVFNNTTGVLPGTSSQTLLQDNVEPGDQFGTALTTGFFSTSGFFDLIVGAPGENVGSRIDAGTVNAFYNTAGVLPGVSSQTLLQDNVEAGDRFGTALTAKLIPAPDSFLDLVVGAPDEDVGATVNAGAANLFTDTAGVLPATSSQTLLQSNIESNDRFGSSLDV